MPDTTESTEQQIIAAVQVELDRFGNDVAERFAELQRHAASESAARVLLEAQLEALSGRVDHTDLQVASSLEVMRDEAAKRSATVVSSNIEARLEAFSSQLAATVAATQKTEGEVSERFGRFDEVRAEIDERLDRLDGRGTTAIDRLDAVDERIAAFGEALDSGIAERVAALTATYTKTAAETAEQLEAIRADLAEIDADSIDEVKEQVSSALGQAELVRIEMERFQESIDADVAATVSRLTAVETAVQDQRMDVESAVQLERLEEVERMVLMIDPSTAKVSPPDVVVAETPADDDDPVAALDEGRDVEAIEAVIAAALESGSAKGSSDDAAPSPGFGELAEWPRLDLPAEDPTPAEAPAPAEEPAAASSPSSPPPPPPVGEARSELESAPAGAPSLPALPKMPKLSS